MRPTCVSIFSHIKIKLEIALRHVSRDRTSWDWLYNPEYDQCYDFISIMSFIL